MAKETYKTLLFITVFPLLMGSCSKDSDIERSKDCIIDIETIDFTFGIDYNNTNNYLVPGEQSDLNDPKIFFPLNPVYP